jgi:hypothetical protein
VLVRRFLYHFKAGTAAGKNPAEPVVSGIGVADLREQQSGCLEERHRVTRP